MTRRALAAATLALVATALPAAAAPARPAAPDAFGRTTFASTNGSVTTFTLRRPATLVRAQGMALRDVTITGGGRMAGIVLAQEGVDRKAGGVVYAIRYNGCWTRGCATPPDERLFPWGYSESYRVPEADQPDGTTHLTLPSGRYKAYVIADGAPVTVTVTFRGARGSGRLRPDRPATMTVKTAEPSAAAPGIQDPWYSAGATGTVRSSLGLMVATMEARLTMNVVNHGGTCYYLRSQPPGGRFVTGCPGGESEPMIVVSGVARMHAGVTSMVLATGDRDGAAWTQGNYFNGAYAAEWMSPSAFLWLDLD